LGDHEENSELLKQVSQTIITQISFEVSDEGKSKRNEENNKNAILT
jgi:hypothetical protein